MNMSTTIRNILAVVAGAIIGGAVNMAIIYVGPQIIPAPEGADVTTMEGLKASLHLFQPKHFIMPFLAHAMGTLAGAWLAALIAATNKMKFALAIGVLFLAGGIANIFMLPAPAWYNAMDVIVAYLPMGWLGGKLAMRSKSK